MQNQKGDKVRILHILDAIIEIENYVSKVDFSGFIQNSMMRFACVKQLEIIGEACNHISDKLKKQFTTIEWGQIIGMRNVLIHEYFGIDSSIVWDIIQEDIPVLKDKLNEIIKVMD